mgnify:CR=1 FL=1
MAKFVLNKKPISASARQRAAARVQQLSTPSVTSSAISVAAASSATQSLGKDMMDITIDSFTLQGQGLCKSHQPIIFVDGALPGEAVRVRITEKRKKVWFAQLTHIHTPHAQRISSACPFAIGHSPQPTKQQSHCGGCQLQFVEPAALLSIKQTAIDEYAKAQIGLESLPWVQAATGADAYRRKARLAIDARNPEHIKVGFRQAHSNQVLPITQCQVLVPTLQAVYAHIQAHCQQWPWLKNVGHLTLLAADEMTVLAVNAQQNLSHQALQDLSELAETLSATSALPVGVAIHHKGVSTEAVTISADEQQWYLLVSHAANDASRYSFASLDLHLSSVNGCRYPVSLDDFVQVNRELNMHMVQGALDALALSKQDRVLDLFCGAGNFSLPIAQQADYVLGVEGVSTMVQQAQQAALDNQLDNIEFIHADLTTRDAQAAIKAAKVNKILLDPSRDGAHESLLQLDYADIETIVYVSCNPQTWLHDMALIVAQGFVLQHLQSFDMFKGTTHTELLSVFVRPSSM